MLNLTPPPKFRFHDEFFEGPVTYASENDPAVAAGEAEPLLGFTSSKDGENSLYPEQGTSNLRHVTCVLAEDPASVNVEFSRSGDNNQWFRITVNRTTMNEENVRFLLVIEPALL